MHPQIIRVKFRSMLDQIGDAYHFETMLGAEPSEIGQTRHRAIAVHDFADHAGRI